MACYKSHKIYEVFQDIVDNKLVLPNFQRGFVWGVDEQRRLLASVLVNLNYGAALTIEGERGKFDVRAIGCNSYLDSDELKPSVNYLLDGQQRITTIYSAFNISWTKDNFDSIFSKLQYIWFLKLQRPYIDTDDNNEQIVDDKDAQIDAFCEKKDIEEDVFGFEHLNFYEKNILEINSDVMENYIKKENVKTQEKHKFYYGALASNSNVSDIIDYCIHNKCIPFFWLMQKNEKFDKYIKKILGEIAVQRTEEIIEVFKYSPSKRRVDIFRAIMPMDDEEYLQLAEELDKEKYTQDSLEQTYAHKIRTTIKDDWTLSVLNFINQLRSREIHFLELENSEFDRAINIFSTLNEGGTPLGLFDLVVARTALINDKNEKKDTIEDVFKREISIPIAIKKEDNEISKFIPSSMKFISKDLVEKAVAEQLFTTNIIGCNTKYEFDANFELLLQLKKGKYNPKDILNRKYKSEDVRNYFNISVKGFLRTMTFLHYYIGIDQFKNVQYTKMILPITLCLMQNKVWNSPYLLKKIEGWYWYTIFSGGYKPGHDLGHRCFTDIFNLAVLLGLLSKEQVKLGNSYEHCIERMNSVNKEECLVMNASEYSDYTTFNISQKINKKLEESLKQMCKRAEYDEKIIFVAKDSKWKFDDLKNNVCSYIRECLGVEE